MVQTLNRLGATRTMEAYLHYIDHIIASSTADTLQPLYGITGDPRAEEKIATSLSGYRGMGPVRFGNLAAEQVQHDVYGSVILAATQLFFDERLVRSGDQTLLERLYRLGKRAVATFEEPDAGPVGIPRQAAAAHLLRGDFLGGLRPAGAHRAPRRRRHRRARVERARQLHAPGNPRRRLERGAAVASPPRSAIAISMPRRCCCRSSACCRPPIRASSRRWSASRKSCASATCCSATNMPTISACRRTPSRSARSGT